MLTVLGYLLVAAVVGAVVFVITASLFGRGEQLAPLNARSSPTQLPQAQIRADDVHRLKFGVALRGYRMSDVDFALDEIAHELDRLTQRINELERQPDDA